MSIIDGVVKKPEEVFKAMADYDSLLARTLDRNNATPMQREVVKLIKEGFSIADIFDITKEQRDAIFAQACRLLQIGEAKRARAMLTTLLEIEPRDERAIYALAGSYQIEANYDAAAKLYIFFIARDATNPEGYLRLGECFLGAKEYENAKAMFAAAQVQTEHGYGGPKTSAYAWSKIAEVDALMAKDAAQSTHAN
jgi:tetratricopeptide (TPR) repeat protein